MKLGAEVAFIDGTYNHEGSKFIEDNYDRLVKFAEVALKHNGMGRDLVNDVYLSIRNREVQGYAMCDDDIKNMEAGAWVFQNIKLFARNNRYHSERIETKKSGMKVQVAHTDADGITEYVMEDAEYMIVSASFSNDEDDDAFQYAYSLASTCDELDELEDTVSLKDNISFCVDICDLHGVALLSILRNLDKLDNILTSVYRRGLNSGGHNLVEGQFTKLRQVIENNDQLGEALKDVLSIAFSNRPLYDRVLAAY